MKTANKIMVVVIVHLDFKDVDLKMDNVLGETKISNNKNKNKKNNNKSNNMNNKDNNKTIISNLK